MDVSSEGSFDAAMLDHIARHILGRGTSGISVGGGLSRLHLLNDSVSNQRRANDILNHFNTLQLDAVKTSMKAGEADLVIRCRDRAIAKDQELGYLILRDGAVFAKGSESVAAGALALTLRRPAAGAYQVFLFRIRGNYASAAATVVVHEASRKQS